MKSLTLLLAMAFSFSTYASDCSIVINNGFSDRPMSAENSKFIPKFQPILEKALISKGYTIVKNSNDDNGPTNELFVIDYATCSYRGSECAGLYSQMTLVSNGEFPYGGVYELEGFSDKLPLNPMTSFLKAVKKIPVCNY